MSMESVMAKHCFPGKKAPASKVAGAYVTGIKHEHHMIHASITCMVYIPSDINNSVLRFYPRSAIRCPIRGNSPKAFS